VSNIPRSLGEQHLLCARVCRLLDVVAACAANDQGHALALRSTRTTHRPIPACVKRAAKKSGRLAQLAVRTGSTTSCRWRTLCRAAMSRGGMPRPAADCGLLRRLPALPKADALREQVHRVLQSKEQGAALHVVPPSSNIYGDARSGPLRCHRPGAGFDVLLRGISNLSYGRRGARVSRFRCSDDGGSSAITRSRRSAGRRLRRAVALVPGDR
jgi:hypothetical protein